MKYSDKLQLIEIIKTLTNRELIKSYREAVNHLNYVVDHRNTGSEWHLGESIHIVFNDAKVCLNLVINEFASRDYDINTVKNVPALIEFKTTYAISAEKEEKILAREAEKNKPSDFKRWKQGTMFNFGSFETAIFEAARLADIDNLNRLVSAFPEFFNQNDINN